MMNIFEENEYVIYIAHKHWFIFATRLFVVIVMAIIPLILLLLIGLIPSVDPVETAKIFTLFYSVYLLLMWIVAFVMWTDYYLDVLVVTNMRIMDIEQKGLFDREVSTIRFETIQEIGVEIEGLIPTFLSFGNLYIQTAATNREFSIDEIANPTLVKEIISREMVRIVGGVK